MAIAYSSLLSDRGTLTGMKTVDGAIGVVLGLYVCSHPAANAVDRWLFGRGAHRPSAPRGAEGAWLVLNLLALLAGWLVMFLGVIRLTAGAA